MTIAHSSTNVREALLKHITDNPGCTREELLTFVPKSGLVNTPEGHVSNFWFYLTPLERAGKVVSKYEEHGEFRGINPITNDRPGPSGVWRFYPAAKQ